MCPVVAPVARVMGNNAIKVIDANLGASGNRSSLPHVCNESIAGLASLRITCWERAWKRRNDLQT